MLKPQIILSIQKNHLNINNIFEKDGSIKSDIRKRNNYQNIFFKKLLKKQVLIWVSYLKEWK